MDGEVFEPDELVALLLLPLRSLLSRGLESDEAIKYPTNAPPANTTGTNSPRS